MGTQKRMQNHADAQNVEKITLSADISVIGPVGATRGELLACHLLILLYRRTERRHLVAFKPKGLMSAAITC